MLIVVIIAVVVALIYDFLNGMNDAANSIATIVSTRILSPRGAVLWAAFFNFVAIFFFGASVANTIGKGIVKPEFINEYFILAALLGAGIWVYFCTHFGLPISVSHSLIGGLIGPGLLAGGFDAIIASGINKILLFILLSPLIGFVLAYIFMVITLWLSRKFKPRKAALHFRYLQLLSSAVFSIGHGSNDAQKTMGIIAVLLFTSGYLGAEFYVPTWVILSAYTAIALGTLIGGWRVVKTLGVGLTDLKPVGGFCAESAASFTLISTAMLGIPVSTTHTITGAIMGVGVTQRLSAVKWSVALNIVLAWVFTIPLSALMSALIYKIFIFWFMN